MNRERRPRITAFGVSIVIHAGFAILVLIWAGMGSEPVSTKAVPIRTDLVFLQQTGPGGGGGGNPAPAPPQKMQIPPHQTPSLTVEATVAPAEPIPTLDVAVQANSTFLQGSGTNLLAAPGPGGGGRGSGIGPGDGPGPGPGNDGGSGGGDRGPGGATPPRLIREVRPAYSPGALAAKIQGSVTLEAEVLANGTVGNIKVIKSLDRTYGLDLEAIKAARQWLFIPAKAGGRPIDVIVQLILDFHLQ